MLVWNHMSGRWLVLHWWTDDERGHLVFARNEASLRKMARSVFKEHTDAEVRGVLRIEMAAPSDEMSRIAAEHDENEKADVFFFEILARLRGVVEAGRQPPSPITTCRNYKSSDLEGSSPSNEEDHFDCANCFNGFEFDGMTKRELYVKYHELWEKKFDTTKRARALRRSSTQPMRVKSRAEKAIHGEPLWFALANFGHHAGGVELHEVDLSDSENYRPRCLSSEVLFFYRLLGKEDTLADELAAVVKKAQDHEREARERHDEKRRLERETERSREVDKFIAFFEEFPKLP